MLKNSKLIAQGAEAKLFRVDSVLTKDRFEKKYRIIEIDNKLRKSRTRREAKVLKKLEELKFPSPRLIKSNNMDKMEMDFLEGKKIRDILEEKPNLCKEIGKNIAILHNNEIIHGDLTTSNMIFNKVVYFIDFGLSYFSHRIEDKAVDLHLFRQALESKHHTIWKSCFKVFLNSYKNHAIDSKDIITRFNKVENRGRHKNK